MKYFGQYKQDQIVHNRFFKDKEDGYFVDIGAYDGKTFSNTLAFEQKGWNGVCFEPHPDSYDKLRKIRNCECYDYAISDTLSSRVASFCMADKCPTHSSLSDVGGRNVTVEVRNFNYVVDEKHIDFLSIDAEGEDLAILQSIDFYEYYIGVILVEANKGQREEIKELLEKENYKTEDLGVDVLAWRCDIGD